MSNVIKSFLESQLLGIILGAILTGGFTWFIEWRKTVGEQKHHLRGRREDVYKSILEVYYQYRQEVTQGISSTDIMSSLPHLMKTYYPAINMYASKDVKDIYNQAMHNKKNKEKELIEAIRKELDVKD